MTTKAIAAQLAKEGDPRRPGPLRKLLGWLAALEPEDGAAELRVDDVAARSGLHRDHVIAAFKALEAAGAGAFLHGRRGRASRFRPADPTLVRAARRLVPAAAPAAPALVPHAFRLRSDVTVTLPLPSDLSAVEARRLAVFVQTLPLDAAGDLDDEPVAVGMSRLRISLPVMIALEEGLFRREGLRIELHTFETAQPLMEAIATGRIPAGGFIAFPISMTAELAGGLALRHACVLLEDDAHPISRLLVRARGGIRRLADLRGRRVGILPTVAYRAWLELLLRSAGVDPASLEIRELPPASSVSALASGAVDALFTNDPAASLALAAGAAPMPHEPRVSRAVLDPLPFGSFVVSAAFAEARPGAARALARALDAAIELAAVSPARARAALAAYLPDVPAAGFPAARYEKSTEVSAAMLATLGSRYHELGILGRPLASVPLSPRAA